MKKPRGNSLPLPKVVLFDLDDTIVDHALTCRDALARLRRDQARLRRRPVQALFTEYSRLLEEAHEEVLQGTLGPEEARVERFLRLARFCGVSIDPEEAAAWSKAYRAYYRSLRRLVPGARRLLERLHPRTMLGVVTNNTVAEQEEKVACFGLNDLLDFLVISEGVGLAKPDSRIFSLALERAGAQPREAVMVGDSWEVDVLGARSAGIAAVWFNRFGESAPSPLPVPQLRSFRGPRRAEAILSAAQLP